MAVLRNDRDRKWDPDGNLVSDVAVTRDVTEEAVEFGLHGEARNAFANLRSIANGSGNMTAAQLTVAVRTMARVLIVLGRLVVRALDDTT